MEAAALLSPAEAAAAESLSVQGFAILRNAVAPAHLDALEEKMAA